MPSFLSQTFSSYFKRILQINQSGNDGADATTRSVQSGDGANTAISLSDDVLQVKPVNDNTTGTFVCQNSGGDNILAVDTTNSIVKVGSDQVHALTLFKEFGLYDFSPTAGYHYPLICQNMARVDSATIFAPDNDWGNGTDPATTLDVSGLTNQETAIAVYWHLANNITIDEVRYWVTRDGTDSAMNFHLFSYDVDTSSNHGDLSNGTLLATAESASATATTLRTGTFSISSADVNSGKVIIAFVETSTTTDVTCSLNCKYHIR
jgi:hypothetical protein